MLKLEKLKVVEIKDSFAFLEPMAEPIYNTTVKEDISVVDDTNFNLEWFNKNWVKGKKSHDARFKNVYNLIQKVKPENEKLATKMESLLDKYDKTPKEFSYKDLKESLTELFTPVEIKTPEDKFKYEFKELFGKEYSEATLKEFAEKFDLDLKIMSECFEKTLDAFKNKKISESEAIGYLKNVKNFPDQYEEACKGWYSRVNEKKRNQWTKTRKEKKKRLEVKVNSIKEGCKELEDDSYFEEFQDELEYQKGRYEKKMISETQYLDELLKVADEILADIVEAKKDKSKQKMSEEERNELVSINNLVAATGLKEGQLPDALTYFYNNLADSKKEEARKLLYQSFNGNADLIKKLNDLEEKIIVKYLKQMLKSGKPLDIKDLNESESE